MKELTVKATLENLGIIQNFVEQELEQSGCSVKGIMQISIAVEEIFVNIARYAYFPGTGDVTLRCAAGGDPLQAAIQFLDSGQPFDPLQKQEADTTLSTEERDFGGLGILMVKKSMDSVEYSCQNGKNILTIKKELGK